VWNRDRSLARSSVSIDPRPRTAAAHERDGGATADEIVPLLAIEHGENFGGVQSVELAPHPAAPARADPNAVALDLRAHVGLPAVQIVIAPDIGLVGLPAYGWLAGYAGQDLVADLRRDARAAALRTEMDL